MLSPTNDIKAKIISLSCENVMLRDELLRFNNVAALLTWTSLTYLAGCDFKCHKRIWLLSLDTN